MNKPKGCEEPQYNYQKPEFYGPLEVANSDIKMVNLLKQVIKKLDKDKMKLKISRTGNGFIVEFPNDNGGNFPPKYVYEQDDTDDSKEGARNLLWHVAEWLGLSDGRYDRERIFIDIRHGDKYECKDKKKCSICGNNG